MGDIFTPEQLREVVRIYNDCNGDYDEMVRRMRPYFKDIRAHLDSKGINPGFAAYAIPYWMMEAEKNK